MTGARLSHLFVHVADLDATRRFYVDLLGLEVLMEGGGYLRVGNADGWHMGMEQGQPVGAEGIELVIRSPTLTPPTKRLADAGVDLRRRPGRHGVGRAPRLAARSVRLPAQHLLVVGSSP